jgi:hypothetical protein
MSQAHHISTSNQHRRRRGQRAQGKVGWEQVKNGGKLQRLQSTRMRNMWGVDQWQVKALACKTTGVQNEAVAENAGL